MSFCVEADFRAWLQISAWMSLHRFSLWCCAYVSIQWSSRMRACDSDDRLQVSIVFDFPSVDSSCPRQCLWSFERLQHVQKALDRVWTCRARGIEIPDEKSFPKAVVLQSSEGRTEDSVGHGVFEIFSRCRPISQDHSLDLDPIGNVAFINVWGNLKKRAWRCWWMCAWDFFWRQSSTAWGRWKFIGAVRRCTCTLNITWVGTRLAVRFLFTSKSVISF